MQRECPPSPFHGEPKQRECLPSRFHGEPMRGRGRAGQRKLPEDTNINACNEESADAISTCKEGGEVDADASICSDLFDQLSFCISAGRHARAYCEEGMGMEGGFTAKHVSTTIHSINFALQALTEVICCWDGTVTFEEAETGNGLLAKSMNQNRSRDTTSVWPRRRSGDGSRVGARQARTGRISLVNKTRASSVRPVGLSKSKGMQLQPPGKADQPGGVHRRRVDAG